MIMISYHIFPFSSQCSYSMGT